MSLWDHRVRSDAREQRVLQEQIEYYRARATEYDDWFLRVGRYDRGEDATRRWFEQADQVRRALKAVPLDGKDVLELAPGTGIWTEEIVGRARHLTVLDSSIEMLDLNRVRLGGAAEKVNFLEDDIFEWTPDRTYDAVIFCFWISHVPVAQIDSFLENVARMITPGGSVFFLDARKEHASTAKDHVLPGEGEETMTRRLDDGREYTIVKNFWDSRELERKCARAGLQVGVRETADFFQFGIGTRH